MRTNTFLSISSAFIVASLFNINPCRAQITLQQSNMPTIGDVYYMATDTVASIGPGNKGPSQSWNYSTLVAHTQDTTIVMSPSSTPYSAKFPSANLAVTMSHNPAGQYIYLTSNSSAFDLIGLVQNANSIIGYNPAYILFSLPATYNSHWNSAYKAVLKQAYMVGPYDSIEIVIRTSYWDTVDAYGSITTPYKTFPNTLRLKDIQRGTDSTYVHTIATGKWSALGSPSHTYTRTYTWYDAAKYNVAQLNTDSLNNPKTMTWLQNMTMGIDEISNSSAAKVFPNPAANEVTIKVDKMDAAYLKIYDIAGREIESREIVNGIIHINTSTYPPGIYLYSITGGSGITSQGKFMIEK